MYKKHREAELPYFWLSTALILFFLSGFLFLGEVVVQTYNIAVPSASYYPFLSAGIVLLTGAIYFTMRLSLFVTSNNPRQHSFGSAVRYTLGAGVPLLDFFALSKFGMWSNESEQSLTVLLGMGYLATVYFLVRLLRSQSMFKKEMYLPLVFIVLPFIVSYLIGSPLL